MRTSNTQRFVTLEYMVKSADNFTLYNSRTQRVIVQYDVTNGTVNLLYQNTALLIFTTAFFYAKAGD